MPDQPTSPIVIGPGGTLQFRDPAPAPDVSSCCATEPAIVDVVQQIVHDWGARLPASRFAGDTVENAVVMATVAEVMDLADQVAAAVTPARPRVWQDGDPIPSGTLVLDGDNETHWADAGYYSPEEIPVYMTGYGTLVEVVLPDHAAEVARAAAEEVQAR